MNHDKYVGRIVRLNQQAYRTLTSRAKNQNTVLENSFLVAGISREMHKLICYGANLRIIVGAADVVLI